MVGGAVPGGAGGLDVVALQMAWTHVLERDSADGMVGPAMRRFAAEADARIADLADELSSGHYRPGSLFPVQVEKDDGGSRTLLLSSPRDRVVERAVAKLIGPAVDVCLSDASHAYRPGRGVGSAVRRVAALRNEGLRWVAKTDIDDFFPSIPTERVMALLQGLIEDRLLRLVGAFLDERRRPRRFRTGRGLPQGSSLSPSLSNLYLDALDRAVLKQGYPMVRYADDIVVLGTARDQVTDGLALVALQAERLGLKLGSEDTEVTTFADGFSFLGEEFNPRYPAAEPTAGREPPGRRVLYVTHPGSYVRLAKGRVIVSKRKKELLSVPSGKIKRIVAVGSVTLAPGLRSWAFDSGIECVFLSRSGKFQGSLAGARVPRVRRLRAQFEATGDPQARLLMGMAFVRGKLSNQRNLLLRYNRRSSVDAVTKAISAVDHAEALVSRAETVEELMGVEGVAARAYFHGLSALLPPEMQFSERTRRPPLDVVNSALGYGYGVLLSEATTALAMAGLDPAVGFLHGDRRGRPSLALDLVEEFRPLIVDTVVASLVRRRRLGPEHGRTDPNRAGVLLTEAGRKRLLAGLEQRLLTPTTHIWTGQKCDHRRQIRMQARWLARCIDDGTWDYRPVGWR